MPPTRSNRFSSSARRIFACKVRGRSPISSRKSVPRCASSNLPGLRALARREGTLFVTKQLRLEQRLRDRRTVDRDERAIGAWAQRVQRSRKQFLPRSALALEEHGHVGRGGAMQAIDTCFRRGSSPTIWGAPRRAASSSFSNNVLGRPCGGRECALDQQQQMIGIDRLGQEIDCAFLHRHNRVLDAAERGHDNNRQLGI